MQSGKRKREVSSCIPCYTRKQKCNRQYPCDRCSRRRQPERCVYYSSSPHDITGRQAPTVKKRDIADQLTGNVDEDVVQTSNSSSTTCTRGESNDAFSLAGVYGYYGQSEFTTMALVRKLVSEDDSPDAKNMALSDDIAAEVRQTLHKMSSRPVIDFLVRYFVTNVNWYSLPSPTDGRLEHIDVFTYSRIEQLLYPPWFLTQYQRWWNLEKLSSVADIEFPVLFLRICSYASQFLPSSTYTIDSIKGVALVDIRKSCEDVANTLVPICTRLDTRGSLTRVLHILFAGLGSLCAGRMNAFWEALSCGTRVAQQIGLHRDTIIWSRNEDELEKEMTRRAFCNLYIWDSCLSKRLDRIPFLPESLSEDILPRMRLAPDVDIGADAPDVFTERVLRARLAEFWRRHGAARNSEYDAVAAEEKYETFCDTFLDTLPPAFALEPDKQWDKILPMLPMHRQLLHNAIFEHLCWNFRPVLFQKPDQVKHLPGYKKVLIGHNKQALAVAALNLLKGASALHVMMGASHTRFSGVIVPTFEATVPLLCLCADGNFPEHIAESRSYTGKVDPLGMGISSLTRTKCMQAARDALARLQDLAEVSNLAEAGARTIARLIRSIDSSLPTNVQGCGDSLVAADSGIQASEDWICGQVREYATGEYQAEFPYDNNGCIGTDPNWDDVLRDLNGSLVLEEGSLF